MFFFCINIFEGLNIDSSFYQHFLSLCKGVSLTLYQTTNFLDFSKLTESADDNLKFDEKGRIFSK